MTEQSTENQQKSGKGKLSIIIIIAIALIGGAITLFLLMSSSDKQTYFEAEINSYHFLKEEFEERFEEELAWAEMTEENPTEALINLSAEYNDPYAFGGVSEIEEIVNNSTITMKSQADMKNEKIFADIEADIAGMTFDDIRFGVEDDSLLLQLPFLNEVLQLKDEDLGKLLHEMDPMTFDEDTQVNLTEQIFNYDDYPISKEDREYIADKYGKFTFNELPDDAFKSEKESVDIDGESVKAEKITLDLSEEELRTFLTDLINEIESDERLKEIMEKYMENNYLSAIEQEDFMTDFDEAMAEAKEGISDLDLPDGIESTIWVKNGLIVKRFIDITDEDDVGFVIEGTQLLDETQQKLDYEFQLMDDFMDESFQLTADLSRDGEKIKDNITLGIEGFEIFYEGDETLKGADREFTRSVSVASPFISGGIFWTGDSKYEKDQMSANHQLHVEADDIGEDMVSVNIDVEGKKIKEIESIDTSNVKDIGSMSEAELDAYIEEDAAEQFFAWYMEKFGAAGF